jgi:hypothetical protein
MKLSEFILQERGPYLFDHYIHPVACPSVLGNFVLEFQVDDAGKRPPDEKMLNAIVALRDAFLRDTSSLVTLVHGQYLLATRDDGWSNGCGLPIGLTEIQLEPLLNGGTITVSQDETDADEPNPGRVYMSPEWDEEHGLYVARIEDRWVKVDW